MVTNFASSPVKITAVDTPGQPDPTPELDSLYRRFEEELLVPLWTEIGDLMPRQPVPAAVPHVWRWRDGLLPLARQAGQLVPVGRGGERRAIALANPGLGGAPYATPTLWAAIQYLEPREVAPEHRHTQNAFRFVVEGEGVWTVVNGDPVAMRRGDFLPQAGWNWHGHHNVADTPMAWLDGLDIPFSTTPTPASSSWATRSPRRKAFAVPLRAAVGAPGTAAGAAGRRSPAPRLARTAGSTPMPLRDQLELEAEGHPGVVEPGACGCSLRCTDYRW